MPIPTGGPLRRPLCWFVLAQVLGCVLVLATGERLLPIYLLGLALLLPGSAVAGIITWVLAGVGVAAAFGGFWAIADYSYIPSVLVVNAAVYAFVMRRHRRRRQEGLPARC